MDEIGPLQLIVIDFDSAVLPPLVHGQIDELRRRGLIRLLDSVVTVKGNEDDLIILDTLDAPRGEPLWSGLLAQALFGTPSNKNWTNKALGARSREMRQPPELSVSEEQLLEIADLIPANSRALILLIEHIWAAELDIAATEGQGYVVANCWIAPSMLGQMLRRERPLLK